jgi:hypothetical protein
MKHIYKSTFILSFSLLFSSQITKAQMVGPDAYMQGTRMEMGITGIGGFEGVSITTSPPPAGMHGRSATGFFGIVANPQSNGWAGSNYDGDFFTPGSPENGWGFEIGTAATSFGNNCTGLQEINGTITSYTHVGTIISVIWEGNYTAGTNLHFKANYTMQDTALYYTTAVSITNNTAATIPDMYYYKNIDPDNNEEIGGSFTTNNTIVSQPTLPSPYAFVSATQSIPWNSYLALIGVGPNWRADYGGFSNRDASDLWTGTGFTQTVGSAAFADQAMSVACRIQNLSPGATETITYLTVVDTNSVLPAIASSSNLYLNYPGENNASSVIPDTISICGTDSVQINVAGAGVGNYTWAWSPGAGLSTTTGSVVMAHPSSLTTYTVIGTPIAAGTPDTLYIVAQSFPFSTVATLSSFSPACASASPFVLSGGSPFGGIYSGMGVSSGSVFNPATLSGAIAITYTITDSNSCSASATNTIIVQADTANFPSGFYVYCNDDVPFVLPAGSPAGGIYSGPGIVNDSIFDPSLAPGGTFNVYYTVTATCSATDSAMFTVYLCAGVATNNLNNNVSVYPNPFTNDATIIIGADVQLKNAEMILYDGIGKEVIHTVVQEHQFKLQRKNLQSGIYFYRFVNDKEIISSGKIMIE